MALMYSPLLGIVLELTMSGEGIFTEEDGGKSDNDSGLASEEGGSNGTVLTGKSQSNAGKGHNEMHRKVDIFKNYF